jgi:hypothetical protein
MDDDTKWERYGALGGIVFVILVIVTIAISSGSPNASDSAAKILKYFRDHQSNIEVAAFIAALGALPIIVWAGSLWSRLHNAGDRSYRLALIAVLGLLIGGVGNVTQNAVTATFALEFKNLHLTPADAKFFFVLGMGFSAAGAIGLATLVLATSVAAFRYGAFPKWVAWLGVLDGIVFLVSGYAIATTSDGIAIFGFISFILWAIWLLATAIIMFRAKDLAGERAAEVPAGTT